LKDDSTFALPTKIRNAILLSKLKGKIMAITIRKEETIERCSKLQNQLDIKTNTGVIDHVVRVHPGLLKDLKDARQKIRQLENELYEIKTVIQQNSQAVKSFAEMCERINGG